MNFYVYVADVVSIFDCENLYQSTPQKPVNNRSSVTEYVINMVLVITQYKRQLLKWLSFFIINKKVLQQLSHYCST